MIVQINLIIFFKYRSKLEQEADPWTFRFTQNEKHFYLYMQLFKNFASKSDVLNY